MVSEMGIIAMQKVEGSNPFSRFEGKPRFGGAFLCPVGGHVPATASWLTSPLPIAAQSVTQGIPHPLLTGYMVGNQGHHDREDCEP